MPREDERAWNCRGRKLLKTKKAIFEKKKQQQQQNIHGTVHTVDRRC